jgi:hypothetical protein
LIWFFVCCQKLVLVYGQSVILKPMSASITPKRTALATS